MKKIILFVICFVAGAIMNKTNAQPWTNFNTTNGMYSNNAQQVTSDKFNNIWIAIGQGSLGYGLDKFDGASWVHYDSSNSAIPEDDIRRLACDTNGNVWMCFQGGAGPNLSGLTKFDGTNWTVYDTTNSGILSNFIGDIDVDQNNNLWVHCDEGLSKFDGTTFTNYQYAGIGQFWGSGDLIVEDSSSIWVSEFIYGLDHFNPLTNIWTHWDISNSNIPSNSVSCIAKDTSGLIWLGFNFAFNGGIGNGGTNGGLATFDGTTFTPIWPFTNPYTGVYGLTIDDSNNVWVATRCEGLYKYDGTLWTNISGVPISGCSFCVAADQQNYIWYTEVNSGIWTNNPTVGLAEETFEQNVNLFPNPTTNELRIENAELRIREIEIYNTLGEKRLTPTLSKGEGVRVDVSSLPAGVYFVAVTDDKGNKITKRFIKM